MSNRTLSRRALLRGAGGAAIALPLLNAMGPSVAHALGSVPMKRLVIFYSPNGFELSRWPTSMNLTGTSLEPLAPHAEDLMLLRGLDMDSAFADPAPNDHSHFNGWAHCLTADNCYRNPGDQAGRTGGNVSVDIAAAERMDSGTRFPSMQFGVSTEGNALSWYRGNVPATPESDPRRAFRTLFSDFNADPVEVSRAQSRRQSILRFVRGSSERLACRLGQEDRARLDEHLTQIRQLEARVGSTAMASAECALPNEPASIASTDANYPTIGRLQTDLMVMALACDLTRVASLQWSYAVGGRTPTWLGMTDTHHNISHQKNEEGRAKIFQINRWYAEQFAYLLERLKAYPEGDGTMLDNTIVCWVSEGAGDGGHDRANLAITMAGGRGVFKTGEFIDLRGTSHNNLWIELINVLSPTSVAPISTFGNREFSNGGLPQIRV